ncbi:MAG: c-type cytochrome [Pseudomonadota bacterium]
MRTAGAIGTLCVVAVAGILFWYQTATDPTPAIPSTVSVDQGAQVFKRYCSVCHQITGPDGVSIAGGRSNAGPNLYNVMNRPGAQQDGFRYSTALAAAGQDAGLIWTSDAVAAYIQDPTEFLRDVLNDPTARSKMSFRLRTANAATDAQSVAAYLASIPNQNRE